MASSSDFAAGADQEILLHLKNKEGEIFKPCDGKAQLQVSRVLNHEGRLSEISSEVKSVAQLKALGKASEDLVQVFKIRHENTWSPMNISRELFEEFVGTYAVFPAIWRCAFAFRKRIHPSECDFPGIQCKGPSTPLGNEPIELAYVIRRAELHGREQYPGLCPWSIRQTGVYYQVHHPPLPSDSQSDSAQPAVERPRSNLLFIAPSQSMDTSLAKLLGPGSVDEKVVSSCVLHSLIVAESMRDWMGYLAWLEEEIRKLEDKAFIIDFFTGDHVPDNDRRLRVEDYQAMKVNEDRVVELQMILTTLLNTVQGIRMSCQKCCALSCAHISKEARVCSVAMDEFEQHMKDIELNMKKADSLKARASSTRLHFFEMLQYEMQARSENRAKKTWTALAAIGLVALLTITTIAAAGYWVKYVTADTGLSRSLGSIEPWLLPAIAGLLALLTLAAWWLRSGCSTPSALYEPLIVVGSRSRIRQWISWVFRKRTPTLVDVEKGGSC